MRVGVISRGSPDYLVDIVTDGFIRMLGRQGVSLDYNMRGPCGGAYAHLLQGFSGPEPFDIREADVLVASIRSIEPMKAWRRATGRPVAILDGEDSDGIHTEILHGLKVYFKREYLKGRAYPTNVRPLPFAAIPEERPAGITITSDVFYAAHDTHPFRREVRTALSEMGYPKAAEHDKKSYNRSLMSAQVGVSARGNGWDTYRYWEIPYFGAALLSQAMNIVIPNDFVQGKEAVFFHGAGDLKSKLRTLLANRSAAADLARAGHKACMERHLSIHRARTVLEGLA